ncbi:MAG TPA: GTP 3',8-cyclase MoaA [Nitrososphaerales archaeon]|nr:GTP 3',8-cyclase MoaA [Nitrososphaerales archaeon]
MDTFLVRYSQVDHASDAEALIKNIYYRPERVMLLMQATREKQEDLALIDSFGRRARKLRLSVIDKCNFRCNFCMPENPEWLPNDKVLSFEEISRLVRIFSLFGVDRIRITGGEPLVRKEIERLIPMILAVPGISRLGLTTNGFFLAEKAKALKQAGLYSVTVSLHSLRSSRFSQVTRRDSHEKVLEGIRAAKEAGFESVKINAVIIRGYNDDEILDFAQFAYKYGFNMRFIEYMPFDGKKMWNTDKVVTGDEILGKIREKYEVVPLEREAGSTAMNYRFVDGGGEFGIITSISKPFCSDCDRIRLTADGKLVPCLFDNHEYDLGHLLRSGADDAEIASFLKSKVKLKAPGVESLIKAGSSLGHVRPMYITGG